MIKKGDKVARLTILKIIPPCHFALAKVRCSCGKVKTVALTNILAGRIKSCGCLRRERFAAFKKLIHKKEKR